jgi:serine/threonine protein kinase
MPGQVYKAHDRKTEQICALKKIKLEDDDGGVPATALREIALLRDVENENIIKLRAVIYDTERLYLSFDFLDKDLRRFMDCVGELPELVVKWYVYQILKGIEHCHARRMLHRDLKPQNILVNRRGDVQLADFGLARTWSLPLHTITHEVATLWYRSPEVLLGEHCYNSTMDIWSVGCIFAELASDLPLFPGDSEIATLFRIFKSVSDNIFS